MHAYAAFVDLNPEEHNQGLCNYPFMFSLDKYNGSCNSLQDSSSTIHVSNKAEDLN